MNISKDKMNKLSDIEIIKAIIRCDREILHLIKVEIEHYPGAIMGLGDFYVEKYLLMNELLRRRNEKRDSSEQVRGDITI